MTCTPLLETLHNIIIYIFPFVFFSARELTFVSPITYQRKTEIALMAPTNAVILVRVGNAKVIFRNLERLVYVPWARQLYARNNRNMILAKLYA